MIEIFLCGVTFFEFKVNGGGPEFFFLGMDFPVCCKKKFLFLRILEYPEIFKLDLFLDGYEYFETISTSYPRVNILELSYTLLTVLKKIEFFQKTSQNLDRRNIFFEKSQAPI
jgi:hypothetical protein